MVSSGKKLRVLKTKRFKNKKKQKRLKRTIQQTMKKKKKQMVRGILFFVGAVLFVGGAVFSVYYQATHLFEEDSAAIVQSYYAVENLDKEFKSAESTDQVEKVGKNIKILAGQMASSGNRKATIRNTKTGQKLINQYYKSLRELGVNLTSESNDFFKDKTRLEGFEADLANVKKNQKAVFDYFGVKESAFKEKQQ